MKDRRGARGRVRRGAGGIARVEVQLALGMRDAVGVAGGAEAGDSPDVEDGPGAGAASNSGLKHAGGCSGSGADEEVVSAAASGSGAAAASEEVEGATAGLAGCEMTVKVRNKIW